MSERAMVLVTSPAEPMPAGRSVVFAAARPIAATPRFSPPFPLREEGVLFAGRTLPAFGLFAGVPDDLRAACAANVTVLSAEDADRFVVEIACEDPATRLVVARTPRLATLGATIAPALEAARKGPSWWSRARRKERFTPADMLKIPPITVAIDGVSFRLAGGGGPAPEGERSLGRGEVYDRYFVCDGPFLAALVSAATHEAQLAVWVEDAAALG